ncbi:MAG: serine/threonine protein kinase [Kofleriaceae bacterium]|nr:serine/threonine protein kinase [Kofleriaceae bacterium]
MEEPLQKSLERYDVLDRIAVGGMAEVFLAKAYGAHGFEKTIAIKRILPELASDPEFAARFIAEAKVAVRLSHANVVQVFDFGRIGESLFIAMEYVDGLDLALLLRKFKDEGRQVPLPAALHIAIEIIRALDFAHQHNVVHRDVSPSNILISRAGEVKMADFGIAVAASPHRAGGPGPRKVMGKWRYMSPEQTRGDTLDTRSDMFSAASVMFELFTGQKLFPGDEAEDIIKNIETMPIPKANSIRPGLPNRLDEILAGPLSRKPIDRPIRPAQVLRSLIELSYESSIMATALDVAEAVAAILPPKRDYGPGQHLDDVIRKQLGAAQDKSVARRTAVTNNKPTSTATLEEREKTSTGLFRKIGKDGVARLEEMEVDPTAVAAPRAKRITEESGGQPVLTASTPDSGIHKLLDARMDADRRTEPGGPPTGAVPKTDATAPTPEKVSIKTRTTGTRKSITATTTDTSEEPSRRGLLVVLALVVLAGGGFAVYKLTQKPSHTPVVAVPQDAPVVEDKGIVLIDPRPEGASGTIYDENGTIVGEFGCEKCEIGKTSHDLKKQVRLRITANKKFRIHIEREGYNPYDTESTVLPNETLRIAPSLDKASAVLHVETNPPGAQVSFAGRLLGETPLTRDGLDAKDGELSITHPGFEPLKLKVKLELGKTIDVKRDLKELAKLGTVYVELTGNTSWAEVYFKGKSLGRNAKPTGPAPLRLPTGKQSLKLVNPSNKKSKTISVDVREGEQTVRVSLD